MAMWTYSQPAPLLWRARLPVTRWPGRQKRASFFDVQVQQLPRVAAFVAARRGGWRQTGSRPQAAAREHCADRRARQPELKADGARGRLPDAPQKDHHVAPVCRQRMGAPARARRAIAQPSSPLLGVTAQPLVGRARADASCCCSFRGPPALLEHSANKQFSTGRRGPGILMDVHPGFSFDVGRLAPTSISGLARVNNLHRNHN